MTAPTTRRAFLAGTVTATAAVAGCGAFSDGGGRQYDREQMRSLVDDPDHEYPPVFPFDVPDAMLAAHRDRARALLDEVPAEPSIPNEAVAREISNARESVSERLETTAETSEPAHRTLDDFRDIRARAAELRGTYLAATDAIERGSVRERRDRLRDRVAKFHADWEYRGESPTAALAANEELERRVNRLSHELEPWPLFPDTVTGAPKEVGYLQQKLETAAAHLDESEQFRAQLATDAARQYRPALMATATWLRRRTRDQAAAFEDVLEADSPPVDRNSAESPADYLRNLAADIAHDFTNGELIDIVGEGGYARGVRYAAQRRAALSTLEAIEEQVTAGEVPSAPSIGDIERQRDATLEAYRTATETDATPVATRVLAPAYSELVSVDHDVANGTSRGNAVFAQYVYVEQFARATVETTREVTHLLRSAAD